MLFTGTNYLSSSIMIIVLTIIAATFVGVLFVIISRNNKSKLSRYNYRNQSVVEIRIQPIRIILFGSVLVFFGCFFSFLFVDSVTSMLENNTFFDDITFLILTLIITATSLYGLYLGVKLLLRANKIIQVRFDNQVLSYMPVNYDLTGKASGWEVLRMYFEEPSKQLKFSDIRTLKLEKPKWHKHVIRIFLKNGSNFSLPFLYYDESQLDELYTALVFRVGKVS